MKKIALLTGTINPKKFKTPLTVIMDENERLKQYLDTLEKYICLSDFEIIIFCENSLHKHDYSCLKSLARKNKKELEILRFLGTGKEMAKRGKGYGEGEIIEHVLKKSKFLKNPKQTFYKITGRIFIKNINNILKHSNGENYFFSVGKKHCVTLFFKCSKNVYLNNLQSCFKKVDERKGVYIEELFYNRLLPIKNKIGNFIEYPKYIGFGGTNGKDYDNKLKWFIRNLQLKLGMLDLR